MSPFNGILLTGSLLRGHPDHHCKQREIGELALHGPQFSRQQPAGVHTLHINHWRLGWGRGRQLQDPPLIPPRPIDSRPWSSRRHSPEGQLLIVGLDAADVVRRRGVQRLHEQVQGGAELGRQRSAPRDLLLLSFCGESRTSRSTPRLGVGAVNAVITSLLL